MQGNFSAKNKKPGQVFCIGLIRKLIDLGRDDAVRRGLAAMRAYDTTGRVGLYNEFILAPWIAAVADQPLASDRHLLAALHIRDPFKVVTGAQAEGSRVSVGARMFAAMIVAQARRGAA